MSDATDLLTVLTELGNEVEVQERYIPIAHTGERMSARATEREVKEWMRESAYIKRYEREVRLVSPWKVVEG